MEVLLQETTGLQIVLFVESQFRNTEILLSDEKNFKKEKNMHCPNCGEKMQKLPKPYLATGKSWYGCEACDSVFVREFCSVFGKEKGFKRSHETYTQFMQRMQQKKGVVTLPFFITRKNHRRKLKCACSTTGPVIHKLFGAELLASLASNVSKWIFKTCTGGSLL